MEALAWPFRLIWADVDAITPCVRKIELWPEVASIGLKPTRKMHFLAPNIVWYPKIFPVRRRASEKNRGKPARRWRGLGHSNFSHTGYKSDRVIRRKDCSPRFSSVLWAEACSAKKHFCGHGFGYFCQDKSDWASAAKSGASLCKRTHIVASNKGYFSGWKILFFEKALSLSNSSEHPCH